MARNITVTFEDGTSHVYNNAPDDVTPDAVEARAAKEFGKRVTALDGGRAAAPKPTGADAIPGQRSISKAEPELSMQDRIMGAIETPIALGAGVIGGLVSPVAGLAGSLFSGKYGTPEGVRAGEEVARQVQSQFYQPRTQTAQQALKTIGSVAEPLIGVPIPTLNALAQSAPAATRAIRDVARSEANLVGGAIAAPLEARAARIQEGRVAESYKRAPIIEATQSAQRQGYAVNPAITNPTFTNRFKGMMVGPAFDEAAAKFNAEQTTNVVRKDLGVTANEKLTTQSIDKALDKAGKPYDVVRKMNVLETPPATLDALQSLKKPALIGGEASAAAVGSLIDDAITKLQEGRSGSLILDDIRSMRRNANAVYKAQAVNPDPLAIAKADAQMSIANILEQVIDANAPNAKALNDMRAARVRMAQIYDHDRAINYANQSVDPQAYAKLLEERKGAMTGVGADIGKVAATFPNIMSTQAPAAQQMPRVARSGLASAGGALLGGAIGGYPGAIAGASAAGAAGWTGTQLAAKKMTTPGYQASRAVPTDYRPPANMLRPVEPGATPNALVPYDYSQQVLTPDQIPNFVMRPGGYGPVTTPGVAPGLPQLGMAEGPVGGQMGALRMEDIRARDLSMRQGAAAEAQQAAAEAATRKPARGGTPLVFDTAGNLVEAPMAGAGGIIGAPTSLESAVQKLSGIVSPETQTTYKTRKIANQYTANQLPKYKTTEKEKVTTFERGVSQAFDLTAEERIAWNKAKVNLAEADSALKGLSDKAVAAKMMDRQWVNDTMTKIQERARAFDEIAQRAKTAQAARDAAIKREQMLDMLADLEESLRPARPVSSGGQGPKTRAFNRNKLAPLTPSLNELAP